MQWSEATSTTCRTYSANRSSPFGTEFSLTGDQNSHTPRRQRSRTHRATLQCRETLEHLGTDGWKKTVNVGKIHERNENSMEDFCMKDETRESRFLPDDDTRGTVFHGRGELSEFLLCLPFPDNTRMLTAELARLPSQNTWSPTNDFCAWSR